MSNQSETKRSYKRWNLNLKDNYEPESVQLGGVGVQLLLIFHFVMALQKTLAWVVWVY